MEGGVYLVLIILKIIGTYVCSSTAKELNRNSLCWGIFGFLSPIIAMIWVNCLSPIDKLKS